MGRRQQDPGASSQQEPGLPDRAKEKLQTQGTTLEDINKTRELPVNGTWEPSDNAKEELPKQVTELRDVNRTLELPDKAKIELPKPGTDWEDGNWTWELPDKGNNAKEELRTQGNEMEGVTQAPELPMAKEESLQQGTALPDKRRGAADAGYQEGGRHPSPGAS